PPVADAFGRQAQRRRPLRRPVRRGGHAAGRDRGPAAGPVPVLPDRGPAGTGLPAAGVRARPLRAALDARAPPGRAAGLDPAAACALRPQAIRGGSFRRRAAAAGVGRRSPPMRPDARRPPSALSCLWSTPMTYVVGFLTPVPTANKDRYIKSAQESWPLFKRYGALQQVEAWGEQIEDGKTTDFKRAVKLEDGEQVVFSWLIWPDKATADAAWEKMQDDPAMADMDMPFDGKRMIWGGFQPVFES